MVQNTPKANITIEPVQQHSLVEVAVEVYVE